MKNRILLAFIVSVTVCAAHAEVVTPAMAMAAADAWAERNVQFDTGSGAMSVITVCDTNVAHTILWHQVSMRGGGCLIIAPVTEIEPVIMALERDPGELPAAHPLRAILMGDIRKRLRFLKLYAEDTPHGGGSRLRGAQPAEEESENVATVRQEWAEQQQSKWGGLLASSPQVARKGGVRLGVGVKEAELDENMKVKVVVKGFELDGPFTHWSQSEGIYNMYTPGNSVCGCVATAMSAMMQFFRVAETDATKIEAGQSNSSCTYNGGPVPGGASTMGGIYDWTKFDSCTTRADYDNLSIEQKQILGRVAYDAGVAVGMQWTQGASGAMESDIATAFTKYFKFHEVRCVNDPKQDQYAKLIYAQNRSNAPVGLGIEMHSVVAVGYGIDDAGVERVRVFMGWGGSGDGWYALPYIDTKSTESGGNYLSEVVDCVITMIGYQDDNVVPVCGRLLPYMNANMTIGGIATEANENGLFGARVSAKDTQNKQVEVVCNSGSKTKVGSVSIGSDPGRDSSYTSSGAGICGWVPDPIIFPLLNSEVALSFADAREKSIASITNGTPKPVLAFSGDWSDLPTIAAWDYLSWLDDGKDDGDYDFTNKYVILCTPFSISNLSESDGNPSVGIFDGRAISVEPNKIWSFYNGRLAYWSIGGLIYTNIDGQEFYTNGVDVADVREFYVTNGVDGARCVVTNSLEELMQGGDDVINSLEYSGNVPTRYITGHGITNAVMNVFESGRENFLVRAAEITLTIASNSPEALNVGPDPDYGTHTMSNGVSFVATAPAFATNIAGNIEYKCVGYTYYTTNKTDGTTFKTTVENTTATDEIVTVRNNDYTITWMWEPSAVKITTQTIDNDYNTGCGTISDSRGLLGDDGIGWFPVGTNVTFKAVPPGSRPGAYWYFENWVTDTNNETSPGSEKEYLAYGDMYSEFGNELTVFVERPVTIKAQFACQTQLPDWGTFNLVVTNVYLNPMDVPSISAYETFNERMGAIIDGSSLTNGAITAATAPNTLLAGEVVAYDTPTNFPKLGPLAMKLAASSATGTDGQSYMCCGWRVTKHVREYNNIRYVWEEKDLLIDFEFTVDGYACTAAFNDNGELRELEWNYALLPTVSGVRAGDPQYQFQGKPKVEDGDQLTLQWIWTPGRGDDITNEFNIQWDDTLDNLSYDYSKNLLTVEQMDSKGWTVDDIHVTTPTGWIASVRASGGQVVATLIRDDAALTASMETCNLTVYPNVDGTYTVEATIEEALRGFWYVLYGSDDLATWDVITSGTYESGTSAAQGQGTAANPISEVNLSIIVSPGDTGAGVKRFYKVVSGATQTPLTTY